MSKIDLKKELKHLYSAPAGEPVLVEVPRMRFLMADGEGDPNNNPLFQELANLLYGLSFSLKFAAKKTGADYTVAPLEGLWWAEDMRGFSMDRREAWKWTLMIMQPEPIGPEMVAQARLELERKKQQSTVAVRFEAFSEGLCAQILHLGPYAAEASTIQRLHRFAAERGYQLRGKHHEIYLGDPRRCAPEKLKTLLRQPVQK